MEKKVLSLLLALVLCLGLAAPAMAAESGLEVNLVGGAYYNEEEGHYVLTEEKAWQSGGLWFTQVRCNSNFSLSLEFYTGHADHYDSYGGADGICVCFYTEEGDTSNRRLGFEGGGGYAVEIDTYQNTSDGDPKYNHIAIVEEKISNHLQMADASAFTEDGKWHKLKVQNRRGICTVYVDDVQVLQQGDVVPNGHYAIGIAAATGGGYNYHAVRNIQLTEALWEESSVWADNELARAQEKNLIPEPLYNQDLTKPITRGEFASVAVRLYEEWTGLTAPRGTTPFTDITGHYCQVDIEKAYALSITNGISDISFAPDTQITREQLATMLCRVYKRITIQGWSLSRDSQFKLDTSGVPFFEDHERISDFARPSVYFMVKHNVMNGVGDNKFAPRSITSQEQAIGYALATREQALVMSLRSLENLKS